MANLKNLPGPTDTVPALLTPGEFVLTPEAVAMVGVDKLRRINNAGLAARKQPVQGFAMGGGVAGIPGEQKSAGLLRDNTPREPLPGWNAKEADFKSFLGANHLDAQAKMYDSLGFNEKQNMMGSYNTNDGFKLQQTGPTAFGSTPEQVAELKAKNPNMSVYGTDSPQYAAYKERTDTAASNYNAIKASAPDQQLANAATAKANADQYAGMMADKQARESEQKRIFGAATEQHAADTATAQQRMSETRSDMDRLKSLMAPPSSALPENKLDTSLMQYRSTLSDTGKHDFDSLSYNAKMNQQGIATAPPSLANGFKNDPGVHTEGSPEHQRYLDWDAKRQSNYDQIKASAAQQAADPSSGINRAAWWNQPDVKPAQNLGAYGDGVPVNSVLAQERRNKGVYSQGLSPRTDTTPAPIGSDRESQLGGLFKKDDTVTTLLGSNKGPMGFAEGGDVPYYYRPENRNRYAGRVLQPTVIQRPLAPTAPIKIDGGAQEVVRNGSAYSSVPGSRPVGTASLPKPPVMIPSQATAAIQGDVKPVMGNVPQQQVSPELQAQQQAMQEGAQEWQRQRAPRDPYDTPNHPSNIVMGSAPRFQFSEPGAPDWQGYSRGDLVVSPKEELAALPYPAKAAYIKAAEEVARDVSQAYAPEPKSLAGKIGARVADSDAANAASRQARVAVASLPSPPSRAMSEFSAGYSGGTRPAPPPQSVEAKEFAPIDMSNPSINTQVGTKADVGQMRDNAYINKQVANNNFALSKGPGGTTRYVQGADGSVMRQGQDGGVRKLDNLTHSNRQSPAAEAAGTTDLWYNNGYHGGVAQYRQEKEKQGIYDTMNNLMAVASDPGADPETRQNATHMFGALSQHLGKLGEGQMTEYQKASLAQGDKQNEIMNGLRGEAAKERQLRSIYEANKDKAEAERQAEQDMVSLQNGVAKRAGELAGEDKNMAAMFLQAVPHSAKNLLGFGVKHNKLKPEDVDALWPYFKKNYDRYKTDMSGSGWFDLEGSDMTPADMFTGLPQMTAR